MCPLIDGLEKVELEISGISNNPSDKISKTNTNSQKP